MTQPLLSICIPTYNRYFYLKRLLDGLLPQISDAKGDVNLFISDNASSDETATLCQGYIDSGFEINYVRNSDNIGPDANIGQAFTMGNGEYVWVLGDDEYIYSGALGGITKMLKDMPISILYLDSEPFGDQSKEKKINEVQYIKHATDLSFVKKVGVQLTFISGVVINKKTLLSQIPDFSYANGLDTNLVQLSWVFSSIKVGRDFVSTKQALMAAEANNTGGYKLYTVFGKNLQEMIDAYIPNRRDIKNILLTSSMIFLSLYSKVANEKFRDENSLHVMDSVFIDLKLYSYIIRPLIVSKIIVTNIILRCVVKLLNVMR